MIETIGLRNMVDMIPKNLTKRLSALHGCHYLIPINQRRKNHDQT